MTKDYYTKTLAMASGKMQLSDTIIEFMDKLFDANNNKFAHDVFLALDPSSMYRVITEMAKYAGKDVNVMCVRTQNYLLYLADKYLREESDELMRQNFILTTMRQVSLISRVMS